MRDRKRFHRLRVSIGFATLALITLCFLCAAMQLRADEVMVYVHTDLWTRNDLLVTSFENGAQVDASCGFGTTNNHVMLPYNGSAVIRDFAMECAAAPPFGVRVVKVNGNASLVSEARFSDGANVSTVTIPPLTHAFIPATIEPYAHALLEVPSSTLSYSSLSC